MTQNQGPYDCIVVGTGPAGMICALALAAKGINTAIVGPAPNLEDSRTTALMAASKEFLVNIGIWSALEQDFTSLEKMRLIDGTNRLIRARETTFDAAELKLPAFGYNILNKNLNRLLGDLIEQTDNLTHVPGTISAVRSDAKTASVTMAGGAKLQAPLVVGADGRRSVVRECAGIEVETWTYEQSALVLNLAHHLPHYNVSTEFHRETGPFTLVPLPGRESSLVCVERPEEAERLKKLSDEELALELEKICHSVLGKFEVISERQVYPMSGLKALKLAGNRSVLIGEAAHAFPPIGAQGLNLSLRDVAVITDLAERTKKQDGDLGSEDVLKAYEKHRWSDITSRTSAVDLLNRSLLSSALPVQVLRSIGLYTAATISPLRKLLMREGIAPSWRLPRLMRSS
ncbi:UbiH/UbiF family hydroxylase [Pseudovibrio exalbescens]|uniref:UbiH/UbiF family hydroxylase n=1 Tax=Pseudovibrio exalbescens TaxID=197461 RepID=UPI002366B72B|nr:UbiH/UbiF family hydroxylase [Pseudovibrio exalbescens]MDD7908793.1 UbiH/UbiF family hydroxylase [Pseudovibrio exalbescens]